MTSVFTTRLLNGPFDDPILYVRLSQERRALLFDCGDIGRLSASEVMRLSDVFISHTHIDHFIGFDQILRIVLGRDKRIRFFGPRGLIRQVRGKLAGYTWNLVENYRLELEVAEFTGRRLRRRLFTCGNRFRHEESLEDVPSGGSLVDEPSFGVRAAVLDHRTPCLAYALEEKARISIHKDRLARMGLAVGPWLSGLKRSYYQGALGRKVAAVTAAGRRTYHRAGRLIEELATVSRGRKVAFVTDIAFTPANERKVVALAKGADLFFCEAAFLDRDAERARETSHLTAAQAGRLAGLAGAARLEVFHFSPRYLDSPEALVEEAQQALEASRPQA